MKDSSKKAYFRERACASCGETFLTTQPSALYCSRACKTKEANLEATRGKQLYRLAYHWAMAGGSMGKAFSDLSWLARQYVKEDREAGRAPPPCGPTDMTVSQSYNTKRAPRLRREHREQA